MVEIRCRGILVDNDGTLVDSVANGSRIWTQWALEHGLDPQRVISTVHGRQDRQNMAILLADQPDEVQKAEALEIAHRQATDTQGVTAISGAAAFLSSLAGASVPFALVTSADLPLAHARLNAAGIPMPEIAVTAESNVASKPAPDPFLLGAKLLGINPQDCVVFEDSRSGIISGLNAGMRVVGVGEGSRKYGPTWVIPDLTAVAVTKADDDVVTLTIKEIRRDS